MHVPARVSAPARVGQAARRSGSEGGDRARAPATWADRVLGLQEAVGNRATREHLGAESGQAIQAKEAGPGAATGSGAATGGGPGGGGNLTGIPTPVKGKMESALGADFSGVRVHPGSSRAVSLGALAYTQGSEIHFAPGRWSPQTTQGQELLGHELWHVVQQRAGRVSATAQMKGVGLNDDAGLEAEADAMGARAARAIAVLPSGAAGPAPAQRASGSQALGPVQRRKGKKGRDEEERVEIEMEDHASSILRRFGPIVDRVAPNPGDTGEIEAKVKIPVDPSGTAYLGFRIKADVERRSDVVKVHFEMALTGGAKVANLVDLGGELGFYLEAQGAEAEDAMALISYGVYRRFRESVVLPREIANFGWGGGEGWRGAERWAAGVENEMLSREGTYVETGGLAIARAEAGISKFKLKGEAKYTSGRHYDEKSISKYKSAGFGEETEKRGRGTSEIIGDDVRALKLKANVAVGPFIGDVSVGLKFSKEREDDGELRFHKKHAKLLSIEVAGSATGTSIVDDDATWKLIGGPVKVIASQIADTIDRLAGEAKEKKKLRDQMQTGDIKDGFEECITVFERLARDNGLANAIPRTLLLVPGSTADLTLTIMGTFKLSSLGQPKFELKITHGEALNVGVSAFSVKAKRGHRTLLLTYEKGTWQVD